MLNVLLASGKSTTARGGVPDCVVELQSGRVKVLLEGANAEVFEGGAPCAESQSIVSSTPASARFDAAMLSCTCWDANRPSSAISIDPLLDVGPEHSMPIRSMPINKKRQSIDPTKAMPC